MTFGRWMAICWGGVLMMILMCMNGMVLYRLMTETGASLFVDAIIQPLLMREICFVLFLDVVFCFAAAIFLWDIARGIRRDNEERGKMHFAGRN